MKGIFSKLFAVGLISAVAGFSGGLLSTSAQAQVSDIVKDGNAGGTIRVISEDNQSWTKIQPSAFSFPVRFSAYYNLDRVWVLQGDEIDVTYNDLYDTNDVGTGLQSSQFHSETTTLTGGTLYLTNGERNQIIAACNAKLKPAAAQQQQQQADVQVPLTLVVQNNYEEGQAALPLDSPLNNWASVDFTLPVICEPFTKTAPVDVAAELPDSKIITVGLGLSTTGPVAIGPLTYTGPCPTGITLNMGWTTNIGSELKTYIKHKDLAGQNNWTSPEFSVTTSQPAFGGNWKKSMTDVISIPFAGSAPSNGGGGVAGGNNPGGLGFNPGGGGGGSSPASGYNATNTGTNNGLIQYIGYFQLVAYRNKQIVPLPSLDGGIENVTVYEDFKASGWRKYTVTCEPQKNTNIPQGPTGVVNPGNQDNPAFDARNIAMPSGVVTSGQAGKIAADIARKRKAEAERRRKAAKKAAQAKRIAAQKATQAKRIAAQKAAQAKRIAAQKAAEAKRRREAARALANILRQRAAAKRTNASAQRRATPKRRTIAPAQLMQLRRR